MIKDKIFSKCKLCENKKKLCKAHIIPKAFYYGLIKKNEIPKLYYSDQSIYPQKRPIGIYDKNILCAECDKQIGQFDDYAAKLLINQNEHIVDYNGGKFIKYDNFDYVNFKLFLLSVLWRASITRQTFFSSVSLGEYESLIRRMINESTLDHDNYFSCILAKYDDALSNCLSPPLRMRNNEGINYYRLRIAEYVILMKVDKRPFPEKLKEYIINPDKPLLIRYTSFKNSSDFKKNIEFVDDYLSFPKTKKR